MLLWGNLAIYPQIVIEYGGLPTCLRACHSFRYCEMPFNFTGKKVLITGAGRGLGRDLAKAIADAGGEVFAVARNKENLDSLVKESDRIHAILADLSDWDRTRLELEKLDVLDGVVNNAAVSPPEQSSLELPKAVIEHTLSINVLAAINVIQVIGKKMVEAKKKGSIVNVSRLVIPYQILSCVQC